MRIGRLLLVLLLLCLPLYSNPLLKELEVLDSQLILLETQVKDWKSQHLQLQNDYQSLESQWNVLKTEYWELESQYNILQTESKTLSQQLEISETLYLESEQSWKKENSSLQTTNTVLLIVVGVLGVGLAASVVCHII